MAYGNGGSIGGTFGGAQNESSGNYKLDAPGTMSTQAFPPDSPSRIRDGIGESEGRLAELYEILSAVERRFETVLAPAQPSTASVNQDATISPMRAHMTERLAGVNQMLTIVKARLIDLLNRAEV